MFSNSTKLSRGDVCISLFAQSDDIENDSDARVVIESTERCSAAKNCQATKMLFKYKSLIRSFHTHINSKLLSLFLVTTSVSLDPDPEPASSCLSMSTCVCCDCNCHTGIDGGSTGLENCFLNNIFWDCFKQKWLQKNGIQTYLEAIP